MIDTISRGTPQFTGRYVCYLPGVTVATVVRLWISDHGWCDTLCEKVSGPVAGWIGPLPLFPENSASRPTSARKPVFRRTPALDQYDL